MSQQVKVTRQLEVGQRNIANVAKISEIDLYTVNIDPGALTVNQSVTTIFAAAQAALGDFVLAAAPADLVDVTATAYVLDTGNIEIVMHAGDNVANLDLAAGDWKVLLIKAS
ncbi:hypothetical protein ES703_117453 [subsurface metagenome]